MPKIISIGKTDIGLRRSNNEDAFVVKPGLTFVAVADGMGGAASGEVASRIFCDTAAELFSRNKARSEEDTFHVVQAVFRTANERILEKAAVEPVHRGMGCTAELVAFHHNSYIIGHVGDSRTYLFRKGDFRQLTRDHSFVQEQVDRGLINSEEARKHVYRNVILRAIGIHDELAVDFIRGKSRVSDLFLLCSDGLHDMVSDQSIQETLSLTKDLTAKADKLIELAKSAGGYDNITVVLCEVKS